MGCVKDQPVRNCTLTMGFYSICTQESRQDASITEDYDGDTIQPIASTVIVVYQWRLGLELETRTNNLSY